MTIGERIARGLFTNGLGETAIRARLLAEGRSVGWLSAKEAAHKIDAALAAEWPDSAPEVRFVVRVYANAGPSDRPDVVGVSGPLPQTTDGLLSRFYEALWRETGDNSSEPAAGFYLIHGRTDVHYGRLLAYENEVDRAARLAREGQA